MKGGHPEVENLHPAPKPWKKNDSCMKKGFLRYQKENPIPKK
jgi:hypothetical protein